MIIINHNIIDHYHWYFWWFFSWSMEIISYASDSILIITSSCQLSCEVQFPDGDNEVFHGFPVGSVPSQIQPAWAAWKAAWARNLADWEGWIYKAIWILFEAVLIYDLVGLRNCLQDRLHASTHVPFKNTTNMSRPCYLLSKPQH